MTARVDLQRLEALAQLVLDQRLGQLRQNTTELDRTYKQLAAINAAAAPADLPPVSAGLVEINYGRWADSRRAELNAVIARQRVAVIEAKAEATLAFGRLHALQGAAAKVARRS